MNKSVKFSHYHTSIPALLFILLVSLSGCGAPDDRDILAAAHLAKGKAFMEQNRLKDGVVVMDNGIQYKIITKGSGKSPKLTDVVIIHSRGKHIDGTVFSDSYQQNKPDKMLVKHMIPGWKKTVSMMSVGSKWIIYIPTIMAFSSRGAKGYVEPNETVIYEIELVSIEW